MEIETLLRKSQLKSCIGKMKIKVLKTDEEYTVQDAERLYEERLGKIPERDYFKILKKAQSLIKKKERAIEKNANKLRATIYAIINEYQDLETFKKKHWSIYYKIKYLEVDDTKELLNDLLTIAIKKHIQFLSKYTEEVIKEIISKCFEDICDFEEDEHNEIIIINLLIQEIEYEQ